MPWQIVPAAPGWWAKEDRHKLPERVIAWLIHDDLTIEALTEEGRKDRDLAFHEDS